MSDVHISRGLCRLVSGMCRENVTPEDLVAFEGVVFGEMEVSRKLTFDEAERPVRTKAFVAVAGTGQRLIWAMDHHRPVPGRGYTVFALQRQLDRRGRRDFEIPVVADPSLLGIEESQGEKSLVVETILHEVERKGKDGPYRIRVGHGPAGKQVLAKHGTDLPMGQKRRFVLMARGLDTLEAFALAEAAASPQAPTDPLIVRVGETLFRWPEQLGVRERDLPRITLAQLTEVASRKMQELRRAFNRALEDLLLLRGWTDAAAEETMKREQFPRLVILEACEAAGRAWIAERNQRLGDKAPAEPEPASEGEGEPTKKGSGRRGGTDRRIKAQAEAPAPTAPPAVEPVPAPREDRPKAKAPRRRTKAQAAPAEPVAGGNGTRKRVKVVGVDAIAIAAETGAKVAGTGGLNAEEYLAELQEHAPEEFSRIVAEAQQRGGKLAEAVAEVERAR